MAEIKKQAHFKDMPKTVILHSIESISAALIQNARYNFGKEYGSETFLDVDEQQGIVESRITFFMYDYQFRWLVAKEENGYLVTFIGKTPGGIMDLLLSRGEKLGNLMDTMWAALINFGVGYLTAKYYSKSVKAKSPTRPPREHIKKAKDKLKQKKVPKKTKIDA